VRKLKVVNCNGSGAEVYSAAIGLADTVCASAASEVVHLWDIGTAKRLHVYTEAHTDIINKVRFHPTEAHMLMSAGDDNLVVVRDARILDEDADGCLVAVLNNEDGVRDFSIIGPASDILCTFSTTEVLRIWSLETSTFGTLCAEHSGFRHDAVVCDGDSCGYAVDLFYDQGSQSSYALCGSPAGRLALYHVNMTECVHQSVFESRTSGHTGVVRSAVSLPSNRVITGGEDGRILEWVPSAEDGPRFLDSGYARAQAVRSRAGRQPAPF
jgi:WD40 repeat protein